MSYIHLAIGKRSQIEVLHIVTGKREFHIL